jgi:hypothetical protein
MQSLNRKIISVKTARQKQTRRAAFLLAGRLLLAPAPVLLTSCLSSPLYQHRTVAAERFPAMETYYFSEHIRKMESIAGDLLGPEPFMLEVMEQTDSIAELVAPFAFSVPLKYLPRDVESVLKKYKMMDRNFTYYDYVLGNVDRILICPAITTSSGTKALGLAGVIELDQALYPNENIIYLDSLYYNKAIQIVPQFMSKASTIVHEASHEELSTLIKQRQCDPKYYASKYDERYANIRQEAFWQSLLRDPQFWFWHLGIILELNTRTQNIEKYNRQLGLNRGNRTLLP